VGCHAVGKQLQAPQIHINKMGCRFYRLYYFAKGMITKSAEYYSLLYVSAESGALLNAEFAIFFNQNSFCSSFS